METIILRKKMLAMGYINSNFITLCNGEKKYKDKNKLINDLGLSKIMKSLFNEDFDAETIEDSKLYRAYEDLIKSDLNENDLFIKVYKVDDVFGVCLGANIFLFHLFPKGKIYTDIVPWYYTDGQIYLGDTWWETAAEIINNLNVGIFQTLNKNTPLALSVALYLCFLQGLSP